MSSTYPRIGLLIVLAASAAAAVEIGAEGEGLCDGVDPARDTVWNAGPWGRVGEQPRDAVGTAEGIGRTAIPHRRRSRPLSAARRPAVQEREERFRGWRCGVPGGLRQSRHLQESGRDGRTRFSATTASSTTGHR